MRRRRLFAVALVCLSVLVAGCETVKVARAGPGQRLDPWENFNRKVFGFNEGLDEHLLKPVSTAYADVVPQPVRNGVGNFFGNFLDLWSAVNNFLQGKIPNGFEDLTRVGTNTLFGLFGVIDVATEMGLDHQYEDFGQTLGTWGFGPGAYLVLPLFGPSSVRDAAALPLDRLASPVSILNSGTERLGLLTLQLVNTRASLLGASSVIEGIALDKYTFLRDAYLQRRRSLVFDGDVPPAPDEKDDGGASSGGSSGSESIYAPAPPATAASAARPASAPAGTQ